jgi:hypothetical protein
MVAFPIHIWAIINILILLPAWMLRLTSWELAGVISYPLLAALIESLIVWFVLLLFAIILPGRWFGYKFASLASAFGWVLAGWAVATQILIQHVIRWKGIQFIPAVIILLALLCLVWWLVHRFDKVSSFIRNAAAKIVILAYLYLIFDLAALVILVIRNF